MVGGVDQINELLRKSGVFKPFKELEIKNALQFTIKKNYFFVHSCEFSHKISDVFRLS